MFKVVLIFVFSVFSDLVRTKEKSYDVMSYEDMAVEEWENQWYLPTANPYSVPVEDAVTYAPIMDFKYPGKTFRRRLDYPYYTIVNEAGIDWAYYTNTIMAGN